MSKQYTDAEKVAYYKAKAKGASAKKSYPKKSAPKSVSKKSYPKKSSARDSAMSTIGGGIGGAIGSAISPGVGTAIGSGLGSLAGYGLAAGLDYITGLGQYKIQSNVFMNGKIPQFKNKSKGRGTVIRFHEYLSDVYTTADISNPAAFTTQNFIINAANPNTFPSLTQLASNFEQYAFEGIMFQFRSTSADALNSTNTALGSVIMGTQYDVSDPVFNSKAEMLNYEYAESCKPSENCLHMVECAPNQNVLSDLYTLRGSVPSGTDSRMFNMGRFTLATVGFQAANVNIGELHVTYQVRLLKPKLYASLGNMNDFALLTGGTWSNAAPLPAAYNTSSQSNFIVTYASGTLTLPSSSIIKAYRVEVFWTGPAPVSVVLPTLTIANGTVISSGSVPANTTSSASLAHYFSFVTLGNSKTVSLSYDGSGTLPASSANGFIFRIMQLPQTATS